MKRASIAVLTLFVLLAACATCTPPEQPAQPPPAPPPMTLPAPTDQVRVSKAKEPLVRAIDDARSVANLACSRCSVAPVVENALVPIAAVGVHKYLGFPVIFHHESKMKAIHKKHGYSAIVGIYGHEFGHLLTRHHSQLLADAWAGCTLRILDLDMPTYLAFMKEVIDNEDRLTWRLMATQVGWHRCQDLLDSMRDVNVRAKPFPGAL